MPSVSEKVRAAIVDLNPAYFALVMATGIVSLAGHYLGADFISLPLLWMNIGFYIILWLLFLLRMYLAPHAFFRDFNDFDRGPGFFTVVAGNCVLATQFAVIMDYDGLASWLLFIGIALWLVIDYSVFLLFTVKREKPPLEKGITGTWLVATVATQSIANLSAVVSKHFPDHTSLFLFIAMGFFFAGIFQYLLIIPVIFYRWLFFIMEPEEMEPPYWINMGALAISTLTATRLAQSSADAEFLYNLHGFLVASAILLWSSATWWLPLQVLMGFWKHPYSHQKFSYSPKYWSLVFPLGMYTACTFHLERVSNLHFIFYIAHYFYFFAVIAWTLTFLGMLKNLRNLFFPPQGR
jgi:tellurite resistance protein TehA-like permease